MFIALRKTHSQQLDLGQLGPNLVSVRLTSTPPQPNQIEGRRFNKGAVNPIWDHNFSYESFCANKYGIKRTK